MCDDHGAGTLTRRGFLSGTSAVAAGALLRPQSAARGARLPLRSPHRLADRAGNSAYSMAMHIHSSFSEQDGSMDAQLYQAVRNAVDVLWWSDHDARDEGLGYRDTVHFTSLTDEAPAPGQGLPWHWMARHSSLAGRASGGGIARTPCSPNDPVYGGALAVTAQTTDKTGAAAYYGFYADAHGADQDYRCNLTGQTIAIDVLLNSGWTSGYLELLIGTSYHEASGGRPAGDYQLSYRVGPASARSGTTQGNTAIITIPAVPGAWQTVTISPADDIAALWPDVDYRDFALWELTLNAVSTGDLVSGYWDYLRFTRTMSGSAAMAQQQDMGSRLAAAYPAVAQQYGLEVSWRPPHLNWFGNVTFPSYGQLGPDEWLSYLAGLVPQIHQAGGLVSYNHPFGTTLGTGLSQGQQDALLAQVALELLPGGSQAGALGCDLLEVGYPLRAGVDLAHHFALWDVMSRNAIFLTGTGVSDDHAGQDWYGDTNNWTTSAWAASTGQADLLAALAAGRAWSGSLSGFAGPGAALDLLVDGSVPMGAASVSALTSRQLTVLAGLPANGSVQVLQGAVDYAGRGGLSGNARVIGSYPAAALSRGEMTMTVDTRADSYLRTLVLDAGGNVVAASNPVWLLRRPPPGGIPAPRQA